MFYIPWNPKPVKQGCRTIITPGLVTYFMEILSRRRTQHVVAKDMDAGVSRLGLYERKEGSCKAFLLKKKKKKEKGRVGTLTLIPTKRVCRAWELKTRRRSSIDTACV
jgi:hypothetical protein